jgi:hypothetical protein
MVLRHRRELMLEVKLKVIVTLPMLVWVVAIIRLLF